MTTQIKYLAFKGIEKKEQILFKSYINLAKNELDYQIVILKSDHDDEPDILIVDEVFVFDDTEQHLQQLPAITLGNSVENKSDTYISRPVQWSEFKHALSRLEIDVADDAGQLDRVLPTQIDFAINQANDSSLSSGSDSSGSERSDGDEDMEFDDAAYEYELDKMSIDYNSFTNSDYVQVVDDVKKFNQQEEQSSSNNEAIVLITDDESGSNNSVLVIETNSHEAWDFSLSETTTVSEITKAQTKEIEGDEEDEEEVILEQKVGLQLQQDEEYWLTDNEIIVDHQTLFYIKAERDMVYSPKEPGLWPELLQGGTLSKLPIASDWQPKTSFKAFPLACLHWVNALISNEELSPSLDHDASYILRTWPQFDLIELDNSLLKLCTMLFVRPESVDSLMAKSGYSRATVVGLINACHSIGLIETSDSFDQEHSISVHSDEGVLGKIKGVFR